jgi:hypothetical protein
LWLIHGRLFGTGRLLLFLLSSCEWEVAWFRTKRKVSDEVALWLVHGWLFGTGRRLSLLLRRLLRVGAGWLLLWLSSTDWETGWFRTKRKVSDEIALWRVHGRLFGTGRLLSLLLRRLLRVGAGWLLLWLSSTDWETGWFRTKRKVSDEVALWLIHGRLFGTGRLLLFLLSSCEWEVAWFRTKRKVSDEVALWLVHGWLFGTGRRLSLLLRRLLRVGAGWLLLWLSSTDWETGWFRTKRKVSDEIALWRVHGRLFGTGRLLSLLLRRLLRVGAGWLLLWLSSTDWETGWLRTKRKVSDEIALWRVHGRLFGTGRLLSLLLRRLLRSAGR